MSADPGTPSSIHHAEAVFHDSWAESTDLAAISVRGAFESPTAVENQFILSRLGSLKGQRVLDIGAGLGESSVYFALCGAMVTCSDLSAGMVGTAKRLAELHGVTIEGLVCPAEEIPGHDNYFDVVYIANTIHHVHDREALLETIHRVLRPGGRFFSIDPLIYNPAINVYRVLATDVRTVDERPLSSQDVRRVRRRFRHVGHREFWIASLVLFVKYFLIDRIHPNADRYWKRILRETGATLWWWKPLRAIDAILTRIPIVRWLAWNVVIWGEK